MSFMSIAQPTSQAVQNGCIAFQVSPALEPVYQEIAYLLGFPYTKNVDQAQAIIADGIDLGEIKNSERKLILACGPVTGEKAGLRVVNLHFDLGNKAAQLLMQGREYKNKDANLPTLDLMLDEIRKVLHREVKNWLELPPIPWGYSYAMTLTHDIDILSLKEMPIARTFLGYFYRSSILNWRRWREKKVTTSEFRRTLGEMLMTWGAKLGLGKDVWERALPELLELERRLKVRSSLYFMPFPRKAGILPCSKPRKNQSAPLNRASFYNVFEKKELLKRLEGEGWEVGVHGIDAWYSTADAKAELERISACTDKFDIGVRMHWLYFESPDSFQALENGGFLYDATFGYNEIPGFRAGTLQPYHPLNSQRLWELPLHIQDGALMGEEHLNLNREDAFQTAEPILGWAKRLGGTVSLLWHNQSFTAPRFWGEVYERLIQRAKKDGAWIAIPRDVLVWFTQRRKCEARLQIDGDQWGINCQGVDFGMRERGVPPLRVRLHISPERVITASVPYEEGDGYVDFPAVPLVRLTVKGAN